MSRSQAALKRIFLGRPMSSGELEHQLLPKVIALPIFSSDALSSVAYATQEVLLVLGLVGAGALAHVFPISAAVAALLALVVMSYRQTVRAYPSGGGAYTVAHDNLGRYPALLAAAALLIDYVLTVSVSVVAGVDAIVSAAPSAAPIKVEIAALFVVLVAMANLRGVRESGTLFAIPTYGFVITIYLLLLTGFTKCIGGCPEAASATEALGPAADLTPFIIFKAFAAGTTALTGVEAISNGVTAFRYPQSKNAATTLTIMGSMSISMFLGISWLAAHTGVRYQEHDHQTVVAQIADTIFGGGPMFYVLQIMTAAILFLAANTAFAGFPRLASILARDRFMPRQFMNLGDRLVYSNGIIILSLFASLLIVVFDADLNRLIQLYLVGVFVSFTLSQTGMVVHWRNTHEPGWRRSLLINAVGAFVTAVVLCVTIVTKFQTGAWIVVTAIPVFMLLMKRLHDHYSAVGELLARPEGRPQDLRPGKRHMVIFVREVDEAAARAVGFARSVRPTSVSAVTANPACFGAWHRLAPEIDLTSLHGEGSASSLLKEYLRSRRRDLAVEDFLTIVVPEVLQSRSLYEIIRRPATHRLKAALVAIPGIQVMDIPVVKEDIEPGSDPAHEPGRVFVVIMVSKINNAVLQAMRYAEALRPTDIRAVSFSLDAEESEKLADEWVAERMPYPLEIENSPFRDIGPSLRNYIRQFNADGVDRVVTVLLPEFVVERRRQQILHGQTSLFIKRHLLFEPGVVTVSIPYHLDAKLFARRATTPTDGTGR